MNHALEGLIKNQTFREMLNELSEYVYLADESGRLCFISNPAVASPSQGVNHCSTLNSLERLQNYAKQKDTILLWRLAGIFAWTLF